MSPSRVPVPVMVNDKLFPHIRAAVPEVCRVAGRRISYGRIYEHLRKHTDLEGIRIVEAAEYRSAPVKVREERLPGSTPLLRFPRLEWGVTPRGFF